jgi:hypothetical protein
VPNCYLADACLLSGRVCYQGATYELPPRDTQDEEEQEVSLARDSDITAEDEEESADTSASISAREAETRRALEEHNAMLTEENHKQSEENEQLRKQLEQALVNAREQQKAMEAMLKSIDEQSASAPRIGVAHRATVAIGNAQQQQHQPSSTASHVHSSSAQPHIAQAEVHAHGTHARMTAHDHVKIVEAEWTCMHELWKFDCE